MIDDLEEKDKEDKIDAFKPILDKTKGILVDYSIVEVDISEGDSFNHETMEAIGTTNVDNEDEHNRVKAIAQKGYKMSESDKIIRHAKVIVGKKQ
jgi:molecular chaperone GrpE (heat shock protein)